MTDRIILEGQSAWSTRAPGLCCLPPHPCFSWDAHEQWGDRSSKLENKNLKHFQMTVGGPNWWKCSKYLRAKRDPGHESSFVILLGILFLPVYFNKSTQVRVFTLGAVSVRQKMSVCSRVKGRINSFLSPIKGCIMQAVAPGPGGTPSHQEWRLSHPAGSLGTALWLQASGNTPLLRTLSRYGQWQSRGRTLTAQRHHEVVTTCSWGKRFSQVAQMAKNPPANAGDSGDLVSIPESVRSTGRGHGNPLPIFLPGKFHEQMSLAGYNSWGHKESDMTEHTHTWGKKKMRFLESALPNCANTIDSSLSFPGVKWSQLHNSSSENSLSFGELEGWFCIWDCLMRQPSSPFCLCM